MASILQPRPLPHLCQQVGFQAQGQSLLQAQPQVMELEAAAQGRDLPIEPGGKLQVNYSVEDKGTVAWA